MQVNGHVYPEIGGHEIGQTFKNPRLVYKNLGNGQFKDVSSTMGPGITERFSSRGAAFGDYDNDGDIDALVLNMSDLPSLLRNDGGNKQNWIKIKLIGTKCNRTAIGARVRRYVGKHSQMDEVRSGSSVMSQNDLRLHFGLGKAQSVDVIEVKWPTTQKDRALYASEGKSDSHNSRGQRESSRPPTWQVKWTNEGACCSRNIENSNSQTLMCLRRVRVRSCCAWLRVASAAAMCMDTTDLRDAAFRRSSWATKPREPSSESAKRVTGLQRASELLSIPLYIAASASNCLRGQHQSLRSRQVLGVSCGDYHRAGAFAEFVVVPVSYHASTPRQPPLR